MLTLLQLAAFVKGHTTMTNCKCSDHNGCLQNILLDGLRLGGGAAIAVEFKGSNGKPLKQATVKAKGEGVETLPLYTNKDTIAGEVGLDLHTESVRSHAI